ncbi:MAG: hypothetical protein NC206_03845 [Bacteroides sp.]|nr:hypothetical protein [Roseburia sp.]MCM1346199.1 hypothetical protein [Bacteroides sp.]MCM1419974.1 hypothetical protein [Bacteroides sp.]
MKLRKLAVPCTLFLSGILPMNAQTDVTTYFLSNADFDIGFNYSSSSSAVVAQEILEIPGWTPNFTINYTISGVYEFGFKGTFNGGNVPAAGYDGEAGGGLALSTGWGETFGYYQTVTLPAGTYTIKAPTYNGYTATAGTSDLSWIPNTGTKVKSTVSSYPSNQWTLDEITFTLTKTTTGKIQVGYVAGANGSANSANLVIDYVQLLVENMAVDKSSLATSLTSANKFYGDGSGNGASDLKTAIDEAQSVYDDDEVDMIAVLEADKKLNVAIDAYRQLNVSEENPLDYTSYILNPNFDDGGTSNWKNQNFSAQSSNSSFVKKSGTTYLEKWVASGNRAGDASISQLVTNLPNGHYKLTVAAQNYNQASTSQKCTGAYIYAGRNQEPVYTPADYSVTFTNISGEVEVGFKAENASGNWLAVDNFRLYLIGEVSSADVVAEVQRITTAAEPLLGNMMQATVATQLQNAIDAAKLITEDSDNATVQSVVKNLEVAVEAANTSISEYKLLNDAIAVAEQAYDADFEGAADFRAAIDAAIELSKNGEATSAELAEGVVTLEKAELAFNISNPTGETPIVVTNPYVARGCRIAFGRATFTANGSTIKERGFCYSSENREPTVLDERSTSYYSHAGNIYYMKDIKPASTYYVRAYAISTGNQVGYGDVVKIVTLPEANCTWSWERNGATDEEDERCQAAIAEAMEDYNYCSGFRGFHLSGHYVPGAGAGDGTADCSYGGWMRISQNAAYQRTGTVQHETNHGVGVGTTERWYNCADLRQNTSYGYWLGRRANELVNFIENTSNNEVRVTGDGTHMWATHANGGTSTLLNYGINGAHEDSGSKLLYFANALLTEYLCEDGLCPTSSYTNGLPCYTYTHDEEKKYYIVSESVDRGLYDGGFLYQRSSTAMGWRPFETVNDSAAWYIEYVPASGYYRFKNVMSGKYMTHSSSGTTVTLATKANPSATENFQLLPGRVDVEFGNTGDTFKTYGYWFTWNSNGNKSLQAGTYGSRTGYGTNSVANFNFSNSATTQRWIIISEDELDAYYQAASVVSGIEGIEMDDMNGENGKEVTGIYSVDGVRLPQTQKGVNIVKYSDGTSRKVILK